MAGSPRIYDYLIALGSNRRHARWGAPEKVLHAAMEELGTAAASPVIASAPLGPSRRRYANAVALLRSEEPPPVLLGRLKAMERRYGRRLGGARWGSRVLDLDIILWSGGSWKARDLTVPHQAFRDRAFVLGPARALAPRWRDPVTGLTVRQLHVRLNRRLTRLLPLPR